MSLVLLSFRVSNMFVEFARRVLAILTITLARGLGPEVPTYITACSSLIICNPPVSLPSYHNVQRARTVRETYHRGDAIYGDGTKNSPKTVSKIILTLSVGPNIQRGTEYRAFDTGCYPFFSLADIFSQCTAVGTALKAATWICCHDKHCGHETETPLQMMDMHGLLETGQTRCYYLT